MQITAMHPEDVKAALRKRFGTIREFERDRGLPEKSVHDVLRGRPNARVTKAVEDAINISSSQDWPQSESSDDNGERVPARRLISAGR